MYWMTNIFFVRKKQDHIMFVATCEQFANMFVKWFVAGGPIGSNLPKVPPVSQNDVVIICLYHTYKENFEKYPKSFASKKNIKKAELELFTYTFRYINNANWILVGSNTQINWEKWKAKYNSGRRRRKISGINNQIKMVQAGLLTN